MKMAFGIILLIFFFLISGCTTLENPNSSQHSVNQQSSSSTKTTTPVVTTSTTKTYIPATIVGKYQSTTDPSQTANFFEDGKLVLSKMNGFVNGSWEKGYLDFSNILDIKISPGDAYVIKMAFNAGQGPAPGSNMSEQKQNQASHQGGVHMEQISFSKDTLSFLNTEWKKI